MLFDGKLPKNPGTFGILRYAPGTGLSPQEDIAAFDGWYTDKADAVIIYQEWCRRYPGWVVAVVEAEKDHLHFGGEWFKRVKEGSKSTLLNSSILMASSTTSIRSRASRCTRSLPDQNMQQSELVWMITRGWSLRTGTTTMIRFKKTKC